MITLSSKGPRDEVSEPFVDMVIARKCQEMLTFIENAYFPMSIINNGMYKLIHYSNLLIYTTNVLLFCIIL